MMWAALLSRVGVGGGQWHHGNQEVDEKWQVFPNNSMPFHWHGPHHRLARLPHFPLLIFPLSRSSWLLLFLHPPGNQFGKYQPGNLRLDSMSAARVVSRMANMPTSVRLLASPWEWAKCNRNRNRGHREVSERCGWRVSHVKNSFF